MYIYIYIYIYMYTGLTFIVDGVGYIHISSYVSRYVCLYACMIVCLFRSFPTRGFGHREGAAASAVAWTVVLSFMAWTILMFVYMHVYLCVCMHACMHVSVFSDPWISTQGGRGGFGCGMDS